MDYEIGCMTKYPRTLLNLVLGDQTFIFDANYSAVDKNRAKKSY